MVIWWFGARWFGILGGTPKNPNPFHFRGSNRTPKHRAPNRQLPISWDGSFLNILQLEDLTQMGNPSKKEHISHFNPASMKHQKNRMPTGNLLGFFYVH